ncbi:MAG: cbb3-type cytochrome c oxidase subunit I [Gemmatimonadota bacterium]
MDVSVRWFLRSAVLWLVLGLTLGVWMGLDPARIPLLRTSHLHALLPGFVLSMIFGVGYHVIPRFAGRSLPWPPGARAHVVLANAGVALLVTGFPLRSASPPVGGLFVPLGGLLFVAGALVFAHAMWVLTSPPEWQRRRSAAEG